MIKCYKINQYLQYLVNILLFANIQICSATDKIVVEERGPSSVSCQTFYTHVPGFDMPSTDTEFVNSRVIPRDVYVDNAPLSSYSQNNCLQDIQECTEVLSEHAVKDFEASELEVSASSNYKLFLGKVIIHAEGKQPVMSIGVALDDMTVLTSASCLMSLDINNG